MSMFRKSMTALALTLTLIFSFGASFNHALAEPQAAVQSSNKGLFVIVTSDDSMAQMMAMVLSTQTLNQGRSVRMLLCGEAGELALKGSQEKMFKPLNKSPQMLLKGLITKGVKVEVCPLYLPNTGHQPSALIEGITIAQPSVIAKGLAEEGVKLLNF